MNQTEQTDLLDAALALAQADMTNAIYNRENPHFKSRYADLASVRHATMHALNTHGISLVQRSGFDEKGDYVLITELRHKGQRIWDTQPLHREPGKPQVEQSDRTYKRRAGWSSICGIAVAGEDDDANIASGKSKVISASQLDELMAIVHERGLDTTQILQPMSERLGYPMENLSQVMRKDMTTVRGWLTRSKGRTDRAS